jgi:20S proteasome alpha/beta subunit
MPTVVGSAVVALKYKDGIVIACNDSLLYHSSSKFSDVERIHDVTPNVVFGKPKIFPHQTNQKFGL